MWQVDRSEVTVKRKTKTPGQSYARVAGVGYLAIIVCGMYAEFFVRSGLIVSGDPAGTAANITASELLFRSALASEFVMLTADVVVALALYMVFRAVSEGLALLAAFFRLAHAAIVGVNLLNVYVPLLLLGDAEYVAALGEGPRQTLVLLLLQAHGYGYAIGLVFFGVSCALLGHLTVRSRYMPRALGIMLMVAAAGYLVDSLARTLLTNYSEYETVFGLIVLLPAFIAELSFGLWLVSKGITEEAPAEGGRRT
jgi:hypothetical protein